MSMLAVASNWLTPTSLFLFLNLVIGTIFVTARFTSHKKPPPHQHEDHHQLAQAPSILEPVWSLDHHSYKCWPFNSPSGTQTATYSSHVADSEYTAHDVPHPPQLEQVPSLLERVKSIKFSSFYRSDPETECAGQVDTDPFLDSGVEHLVERGISESRVVPKRHAHEKMKKSFNEKALPMDDEEKEEKEDREELERRQPATMKNEKTVSSGDEGVDAKADDFINKFRQQLRMQRPELSPALQGTCSRQKAEMMII